MSIKNQSADELLSRAYALDGAEPKATKALYRDWAETYDQTMVDGLAYASPTRVADLAGRRIKAPQIAEVLDVGCGTGLLAQALRGQGFERVSGLDYSAEMLAQALALGRIDQAFEADLNGDLDLPSQSFDLLASTGTFTHGHVGGQSLVELCRLLKIGGLLICTVHQDVWDEGKFGVVLAGLEQEGRLSVVEKEPGLLFETDKEPTGWYLVAKRLA